MKVEKLNEAQLKRLEFLLCDWSHNIKHKNFVIPDILKKMEKGVE